MKDDLILQALQQQAIAATTAASIPLKIIGRTFKPPTNGQYLEQVFIPNNVKNEFWGDTQKTYQGIYRLILHWGLDDAGVYPLMRKMREIATFFDKGALFQNGGLSVRITEKPDLTGVIEEPPEMICMVSVRYNCFDKG